MSDEKQIKPGFAGEIILPPEDPWDDAQGIQGETMAEDEVVLDQIIIAPEIMNIILKHLDFSSLKRVRLVCKSWLLEARDHLEKRGLVSLYSKYSNAWLGVRSFISLRQEENHFLPQAFRCLEVNLGINIHCRPNLLRRQLSNLCPPLVISRFDPGIIPFDLAFLLVTRFASSLEFLKLSAKTCEEEYKPMLDPKLYFPKLQHLVVDGRISEENPNNWIHFPSTVAWIVRASPNLTTYESWCAFENSLELASELLLQVDLKSVKELLLLNYSANREAFEHFLSIPFSQLQKLRVQVYPEGDWGNSVALISTVAKSVATLKSLNLLDVRYPGELTEFPICPNVQAVRMIYIPYRTNFLSDPFPALQVLEVQQFKINVLAQQWRYHRLPFPGLKTLRLHWMRVNTDSPPDEVSFNLLVKFPGLERLCVDPSMVLRCCRLKASGDPRYSNLLEGVKHFELAESVLAWPEAVDGSGYAFLSILKGIETIKLLPGNNFIGSIPFEDISSLRAIEFPWDDGLNMNKLLEMARRVDKVVVTNCCAPIKNPRTKELLTRFFEAAPNAKCGCKDLEPLSSWD